MKIEKPCTKCNIIKPLQEFGVEKRASDGKTSQCLSCQRAKKREYIKANREKLAAKERERQRSFSSDKKQQEKERKRQAYQNMTKEQKQCKREYDKEYFSSERGKMVSAASNRKRRRQIRITSDGTVTAKTLEDLKVQQDCKCYHCGTELDFKKKYSVHLDHIHPLSKGGIHSSGNVCWSCQPCNSKKHANLML